MYEKWSENRARTISGARERRKFSVGRSKVLPEVRINEYLVRIAKTYFRALPRAVAASIDIKLRHNSVYHAFNALTKFCDLRRSGIGCTPPQRHFYNRRSSIPLNVQHPCFDRVNILALIRSEGRELSASSRCLTSRNAPGAFVNWRGRCRARGRTQQRA